jgi:DDE superfamily endonuclease
LAAKKTEASCQDDYSGERGRTITILCCMSAVGSYVPPLMVFPRKCMNDRLMHNAPPLAIGLVSDSCWINGELFVKWFTNFGKCTNSSTSNKQLLIVDGHRFHKSLAVITQARQLGITMILLPSHTAHELQPLGRAFFGPLKKLLQPCM